MAIVDLFLEPQQCFKNDTDLQSQALDIKFSYKKYTKEIKRCYIFCEKDILVKNDKTTVDSSFIENLDYKNIMESFIDSATESLIIQLKNESAFCKNIDWIPIRQYFAENDNLESERASRAKSLLNWKINTKFCVSCGNSLKNHQTETALICPACQKVFFPHIEPCIIALIQKNDQILLAKHKNRNQNVWTCIAGFIEAGESVENAVQREIKEEVGLEVENIQYAGSQAWPYPDQLMLAFYVDWKAGEIKIQQSELEDARWFNKNQLPTSTKPGSVAYNLIHGLFKKEN